MSFDVFLCFTIPIVWILSALLAHRLFVRRGYPQSESWLPGCLLGPIGVFIAARIPQRGERQPAEDDYDPAQENEKPDNRLWIQSADYSSKIHPLVDANESIRMYRAHDWTKELARLIEMRAERQDCCPPGMGFLKDDGRFLHICPNGNDRISVYFEPANTPKSSTWTYSDLPESDAEVAIQAFHSGEDAWFRANTSYGS